MAGTLPWGWLRRFPRRLSRLPGRGQPIAIELDVAEQLILRFLIRRGDAPALDLMREVQLARPLATDQQIRLSLIRLTSLRLIEVAAPTGGLAESRGRAYRITSDGRRLRRVIPSSPTARLQTYL